MIRAEEGTYTAGRFSFPLVLVTVHQESASVLTQSWTSVPLAT